MQVKHRLFTKKIDFIYPPHHLSLITHRSFLTLNSSEAFPKPQTPRLSLEWRQRQTLPLADALSFVTAIPFAVSELRKM